MNRIFNISNSIILLTILSTSCVEDKLYIADENKSVEPIKSEVSINEVFANGDAATYSDWVELYNDSEIAVNIGGYSIYDEGIKSGAKSKRVIAEGITIPAKSFLVLNTDIDANETVLFGLSTTSETVYLENKQGVVVSQISWDATILGETDLKSGKSYGRKPDGSTNFVIFTTPTKGTSNNNAN